MCNEYKEESLYYKRNARYNTLPVVEVCKKCCYKRNRKYLSSMKVRGSDEYYNNELTEKEHSDVKNGTLRLYLDINKFLLEELDAYNWTMGGEKVKKVKIVLQHDKGIGFGECCNTACTLKEEYKNKQDKREDKPLYDVIKILYRPV